MAKKTTAPKNIDLLSPREDRFCEEWPIDGNGTQAAIRAGYSEAGAHVQASRMLKRPKIRQRIREVQAEMGRASKIDAHVVRRMLLEDHRKAVELGQMGPAARCVELIGKTFGVFVDKQQIEHTSDRAMLEGFKKISPELAAAVGRYLPPDTFDDRKPAAKHTDDDTVH